MLVPCVLFIVSSFPAKTPRFGLDSPDAHTMAAGDALEYRGELGFFREGARIVHGE